MLASQLVFWGVDLLSMADHTCGYWIWIGMDIERSLKNYNNIDLSCRMHGIQSQKITSL